MRGPHVFRGLPPRPRRDRRDALDGWLHSGDLGDDRRRRLPAHHRPQEGPDHHLERQEHLARRTSRRAARDALDLAGGRLGDRRSYLVALFTLDPDEVPKARRGARRRRRPATMATDQRVRAAIQEDVDAVNAPLARDRADQALRHPRARPVAGRRRAHPDAEGQARPHLRRLRGPHRSAVRLRTWPTRRSSIAAGLDALLTALRRRGFTVIGPRCAPARSSTTSCARAPTCPAGWTDEQDGGHYRLARRDDERAVRLRRRPALVEAASCFPPELRALARAARRGRQPARSPSSRASRRATPSSACAPATCTRSRSRTASSSADRYVDPDYAARREDAFIVAVNCGQAGGTCFCVSMDTGPQATRGFDLALTELLDGRRPPLPRRGRQRARRRGARRAAAARRPSADEQRAAERASERAAAQMGRDDGHRRASRTCCTATSSTRAGTTSPTAA